MSVMLESERKVRSLEKEVKELFNNNLDLFSQYFKATFDCVLEQIFISDWYNKRIEIEILIKRLILLLQKLN